MNRASRPLEEYGEVYVEMLHQAIAGEPLGEICNKAGASCFGCLVGGGGVVGGCVCVCVCVCGRVDVCVWMWPVASWFGSDPVQCT